MTVVAEKGEGGRERVREREREREREAEEKDREKAINTNIWICCRGGGIRNDVPVTREIFGLMI